MPHLFPQSDVSTEYFTDNNASGGEGGDSFTFITHEKGGVLKKIQAWKVDACIRGLEVWMTDGSSRLVGTRSGLSSAFSFENGERITRLNIDATNPHASNKTRRLGAIRLQTNRNKAWEVLSANLQDDGGYSPEIGSGVCCGIFGASGADVDRLGFAMLQENKRSLLMNVHHHNLTKDCVATTKEIVAHQVLNDSAGVQHTLELSGTKFTTINTECGCSTSSIKV
ncbi:hypothetical protein DPMN_081572 [Dreissena polymorpha]|uniref:Jacalin-type lectin domain-containing protein n=1 Tax=Dreissena polymorpha TaxID=45954 RepID=A0A9D4BHW9_DREPO|nr:hypothetical protein DPMN_081572 [Dreissena polymorpha]